MKTRRITRVLLLFLVAVLTFTAAGAAYAQASDSFDLGCWGVLTAGGGTRTSSAYIVKDAIGQVGAGAAVSSSYIVRSGYSQDWSNLGHINPDQPEINPDETNILFLPYVARTVRNLRTCPW